MRSSLSLLLLLGALVAGCHDDGLAVSDQRSNTDAAVDHAAPSPCSTITIEEACRARTDCTAATCQGCSCAPTFVACLGPTDKQPPCPTPPCAPFKCCHTTTDCQPDPGGICLPVPWLGGCGGPVCMPGPSTCSVDSDCNGSDPTQICEYGQCSCDSAYKSCKPGCTRDADCYEPQQCGANHRCHDRPCDAKCTGSYACDTTKTTCQRKSCTVDADCGTAGFCVEKQCSKNLGMCGFPPV